MRKIYLTVDTECHDYSKRNQYITGKTKTGEWGIRKILNLGKEENIPINFFVDVGEAKRYGDQFIKDIVDLIHMYHQPVFFHLHPNYLSGDDNRTFLWQYTHSEKVDIFQEAYSIYRRFAGEGDKLIFRAGRYGIDEDLLSVLNELGIPVLDLSYICEAPKMCHLNEKQVGSANAARRFHNVVLLPTTRFIGFDYFGRKKCIGLDCSDATFNEFKRILKQSNLENITLTMHSWNFIKKYFFSKSFIAGDNAMIRKFKKSVNYAKNYDYTFSRLTDFSYVEEKDELINLCESVKGKFWGIFNNFVRFKKIGRLNPKYFFCYIAFYSLLLIIIFTIIIKLI